MSTASSAAAAATVPATENSTPAAAAAGGACAATVKVAVRVRPLIGIETSAGCQPCLCGDSENNQIIVGDDRIFQVDCAFGSESTQEEVYAATVRPLVQRSLEGYNSCVFAYGQSGSGITLPCLQTCATSRNIAVLLSLMPSSSHTLYTPFVTMCVQLLQERHIAWAMLLT
jgi:Kinesin motor domain